MLNDFIAYYIHCSDYTITHPVIDVICNDVTRSLYHLYHCFGGDTDDTDDTRYNLAKCDGAKRPKSPA